MILATPLAMALAVTMVRALPNPRLIGRQGNATSPDRNDLNNLKPVDWHDLLQGSFDPYVKQLFENLDLNYTHTAVSLARSSYITNISCESNTTLAISFSNKTAFNYIENAWKVEDQGQEFVVITPTSGCKKSQTESSYWLVTNITYPSNTTLTAILQVEDLTAPEWAIDCDVATENKTYLGLPTSPCGDKFDPLLDNRIGYYNFNKNFTRDLKRFAPGLQSYNESDYTALETPKRALNHVWHKRAPLNPSVIGRAIANVTIVNALENLANLTLFAQSIQEEAIYVPDRISPEAILSLVPFAPVQSPLAAPVPAPAPVTPGPASAPAPAPAVAPASAPAAAPAPSIPASAAAPVPAPNPIQPQPSQPMVVPVPNPDTPQPSSGVPTPVTPDTSTLPPSASEVPEPSSEPGSVPSQSQVISFPSPEAPTSEAPGGSASSAPSPEASAPSPEPVLSPSPVASPSLPEVPIAPQASPAPSVDVVPSIAVPAPSDAAEASPLPSSLPSIEALSPSAALPLSDIATPSSSPSAVAESPQVIVPPVSVVSPLPLVASAPSPASSAIAPSAVIPPSSTASSASSAVAQPSPLPSSIIPPTSQPSTSSPSSTASSSTLSSTTSASQSTITASSISTSSESITSSSTFLSSSDMTTSDSTTTNSSSASVSDSTSSSSDTTSSDSTTTSSTSFSVSDSSSTSDTTSSDSTTTSSTSSSASVTTSSESTTSFSSSSISVDTCSYLFSDSSSKYKRCGDACSTICRTGSCNTYCRSTTSSSASTTSISTTTSSSSSSESTTSFSSSSSSSISVDTCSYLYSDSVSQYKRCGDACSTICRTGSCNTYCPSTTSSSASTTAPPSTITSSSSSSISIDTCSYIYSDSISQYKRCGDSCSTLCNGGSCNTYCPSTDSSSPSTTAPPSTTSSPATTATPVDPCTYYYSDAVSQYRQCPDGCATYCLNGDCQTDCSSATPSSQYPTSQPITTAQPTPAPDSASDLGAYIPPTTSDPVSSASDSTQNADFKKRQDVAGSVAKLGQTLGYTQTPIRESSQAYGAVGDEQGNIRMANQQVSEQVPWNTWGDSAVTDSLDRFLHYFPDTMDEFGVSRLRVADGEALPEGSSAVALTPIDVSTTRGTQSKRQNRAKSVYVPLNTKAEPFYPIMCTFQNSLVSKLYISKTIRGVQTLQNPRLRKVLTGGKVKDCGVVSLESRTVAGIQSSQVRGRQ